MALRFNTIMRALLAGNSTPSVPSFYFNFSNPSNVTLGAEQARGNITSTQNAHITMSASLSRVVGVAPLYVNIDMTGTTSDLTANATHDLFYSVNWGDPGAGQWANGVQSSGLTDKNWSFGPVGGHVFETPGTYLVTPTSTDGVNSAAKPGYVTVLDPNVVYDPAYGAGYETICISNSNNFTGAPGTGALPGVATYINRSGDTDMYAAWNTYKASNKRILFCKADSWTSSATISFSGLTGTMLNGYGTGPAHTFASGTLVNLAPATGPATFNIFQVGNSTDCHLGNIKVAANGSHTVIDGAAGEGTAMMMYKLESRGAICMFTVDAHSTPGVMYKRDQTCVYECLRDQAFGYAAQDTPRVTGASGAAGTPGVFTSVGHPFTRFSTVRLFGTPPTGLNTGTNYYIAAANLTANTFSLNAAVNVEAPLGISAGSTCDVTAQGLSGGQGVFVALTRGGIMGCYFDNNNNGEQAVRLPYLDRAHVNNNYMARPNQTKNIFKIHCRPYDDISMLGVSGYSEKFVVSANVMDLRGGYSYDGTSVTFTGTPTIVVGNGGAGSGGQRVRNAIFENNFTYACLGSPKDLTGFIEANCPNLTIRNNIMDASMGVNRAVAYSGPYSYSGIYFATITTSTPDQTKNVRIYNNTLYSNCSSHTRSNFALITLGAPNPEVDLVTIKNNIWYTPFYGGADHGAWRDSGGAATNIVASNNTDTVAGRSVSSSAADNFAVHPPVALADWRPRSGSYAIGTGAALPVYKDFFMASRTIGTDNMGAVLP